MSALAGTGALLGAALRRDRVVLPAWIYGTVALAASTALSADRLYPTAASRAELAASIEANGSVRALTGQPFDLSTVGGYTAWRVGGYIALVAGLMSLLLVVRHSRAEEEAGRAELVGAGATGRHAVLAAALAVAGLADLVAAGLITAILLGAGEPLAGAVALGAAAGAAGLVFAGVAAVTAQVASTARAASGAAGAVLAAAFLVRGIGDVRGGAPSWLSPLGWAEQVRPYAGDRWAVLLLPLAAVVLLVAAAAALLPRRDLGAGLLPVRPGPAEAAPRLRGPLALAWRLQRGTLLGWTVGVAAGGLAVGSVAADVGGLIEESQAADVFRRLGGGASDLVTAYLSSVIGLVALVTAGYAIQAVLRVRAEETSQRAEPVLAAAVSRTRWAGAHVLLAAAGSAWLMLVLAVTTGLLHGARVGDVGGQVRSLVAASLAQVPAVWVLAGLAVALTGVLPRLVGLGWAALGACLAVGQLGEVLELPDGVLDLSPFRHVPSLPVGAVSVLPLAMLLAVAAVLAGAGLSGLRRRDIG
jgi:ABC-2 type transport system permease protein